MAGKVCLAVIHQQCCSRCEKSGETCMPQAMSILQSPSEVGALYRWLPGVTWGVVTIYHTKHQTSEEHVSSKVWMQVNEV